MAASRLVRLSAAPMCRPPRRGPSSAQALGTSTGGRPYPGLEQLLHPALDAKQRRRRAPVRVAADAVDAVGTAGVGAQALVELGGDAPHRGEVKASLWNQVKASSGH